MTFNGFGGGRMVWLFDANLPDPSGPYFGRWTQLPSMQVPRWYPAITLEPQGRLIIAGGTHLGSPFTPNNYEALVLLAGTATWDFNNSNPTPQVYAGPTGSTPYFGDNPRMHALTDGRVFYSGFYERSVSQLHQVVPTTPPLAWDNTIGNGGGWPFTRWYGSHFILPKPVPGVWDYIVRTGGARAITGGGIEVTNSVDLIIATQVASQWASALPMIFARYEHNTVLLPDGTVFAIGGQRDDHDPYDCTHMRMNQGGITAPSVYHPEILSSAGWAVGPTHFSPRIYHSTALLLPDARVLVAGGECRTRDYEIYKPPYLTSLATKPRPTGVAVSSTNVGYNFSYSVTWTAFANPLVTVDKVVLMRPGAVTHHNCSSQRYIELQSTLDTSTDPPFRRYFTTPPTNYQAPKGWYMLFLLTNDKVPSVAKWVNLQ